MMFQAQIIAVSIAALVVNGVTAQTSGKCSGQSCYIAFVSGSSQSVYELPGGKQAVGANASGEKCIKTYLGKLGVPLPEERGASAKAAFIRILTGTETRILKREDNLSSGKFEKLRREQVRAEKELVRRQAKGGCKPYTLLYSRGTFESGALGMTVGPALSKALDSKQWNVQGLTAQNGYDAAISNNYCVGLPGGYACKDVLNKLSATCPETKIVVGGYSQGAMVSRICVAYANEKARKQVKGLLLYGDPMNGADVKGFPTNRIKTICKSGDGVCKGEFSITAAHLAYSGTDITSGAKWANEIVQS